MHQSWKGISNNSQQLLFPVTMDAVPVCFIEEVVLQLERLNNSIKGPQEVSKLSSIWGRITKLAVLEVYLSRRKLAVFSLKCDEEPVAVEELGQITIQRIEILDNIGYELDCHPLTKANFELLRKSPWRNYPCELSIRYSGANYHPVVDQLCLMPSRVTKFKVFSYITLPRKPLARIMENGNLRSFECYSGLYLTADLLPLLLKFVASKDLSHFTVVIGKSSPVSCETFINGMIDAFLSRERTKPFRFCVGERYEHLCGRFTGTSMAEKVEASFITDNYAAVLLAI
uniref:FBD domain-containing protein n=1 Tax=Steinernema glaseri TaxID=37863 RepID=A0A1I7YKN9_9BILA